MRNHPKLRAQTVWFGVAVLLLVAIGPVEARPTDQQTRFELELETALKVEPNAVVVVYDEHDGKIIGGQHLDQAAKVLAPPGSAIKPFTLVALLDAGAVKEEETFLCRRKLRIKGHQLDCTHNAPAEALNGVEALAFSCNNYFAQASARLTDEQLTETFRRFGMNGRSAATKEDLQLKALGVSGIEVTPMQLAQAYLDLLRENRKAGVDEPVMAALHGLEQSVSYGRGRDAQSAQIEIAGKTGTALGRNNFRAGWFAGYASSKWRRIVVVVYAPNVNGARAAGVARSVFEAWHWSQQ